LVVSEAGLEDTVSGSVGRVVFTAHTIEPVLAKVVVGRIPQVASLEAELAVPDEVMPLWGLLRNGSAPLVGIDEASHRIAAQISAMGVHLSSIVALKDVKLGLVKETNGLNVSRRLGPLHTGQRALGNKTGSMTGFGAPRNHDSLDVANRPAILGGTPKAEVVETVENHSLAQ